MKYILLACTFFIVNMATAQDNSFSTNAETGLAEYSKVVPQTGVTAATLYERGLTWINEYYPNPTGTIKTNEAGEKLVCKARFKVILTDKKGNTSAQSYVNYNLTFEFKDGKYRYVLDRICWDKPSYYDVTKWENKDDPMYQADTYPKYVEQTVTFLDELIAAFETGMNTPAKTKSSDW